MPPAKSPAILTPFLDLFCCGGASIIACLGILIYGEIRPYSLPEGIDPRLILVLSVAVNGPHFMASYRLMYLSGRPLSQHRWAGLLIPALLAGICLYTFLAPDRQSTLATVSVLATLLLGWHYTGQAWGMVASFLFLSGVRMEPVERRLIRSGFRVLLVWHILWAILYQGEIRSTAWYPLVDSGYLFVGLLAVVGIPLGLAGFGRIWHRTGQVPSLRAFVSWMSIYFWYLLIFVYPFLFLFLQMAHALQYLIFPMRVEMNRFAGDQESRSPWGHMLWYYAILAAAGFLVFHLPEMLFAASELGSPSPRWWRRRLPSTTISSMA